MQRYPLLIGGQWRDGLRLCPNRNPSDLGDLVGEYAEAGEEDMR